ncbi:stemmadenine O-acetyltransferase-like [Mangifera indica]|uniref:stemmadenine O-acetyltransferase-like n=1 Tax=Mangifera indica TaxID=29780 RepID=UPI001CFC285A|nr:stemmadenine O-acetyltransferase-like [Mangifera indica]
MEVHIISRENIKPSSPTPQHLKIFKLSLLDQLICCPYAPIVFFYAMNDSTASHDLDIQERLALLKTSLSETLTRFYPFAGKMKDDLSIECNDEGAYYVETRVNCCVEEFLSQPDLMLLHEFLPCDLINTKELATAGACVTNIQINVFDCGGIAVGVCISHRIVDGAALSTFLKAWTSTVRGCDKKIYPNLFANSQLFPANDLWLRDTAMATWGCLFIKGNCITRRFVFDASAITTLKNQSTSSTVKNPTRVEAVSAFIWKYTMAASKDKNGSSSRPSLLTHLVNLRTRMVPPISDYSTGNLLWLAAAECSPNTYNPELHNLAAKMRRAISKFDGDFVKTLTSTQQGNAVMSESLKEMAEFGAKDEVDYFGFSSWCKFGFYENDFGWGKPVWVSSVGLSSQVFMNLVILVETKSGDGMEAWLTLDEKDMNILVSNPEFLRFASVDPSPLLI